MSTETATHPSTQWSLKIPAHLRAPFLKVEAQLKKELGTSPSVEELIIMWLGCATPEIIVQEFEEAVLGITGSTLRPNAEGQYDETSL